MAVAVEERGLYGAYDKRSLRIFFVQLVAHATAEWRATTHGENMSGNAHVRAHYLGPNRRADGALRRSWYGSLHNHRELTLELMVRTFKPIVLLQHPYAGT